MRGENRQRAVFQVNVAHVPVMWKTICWAPICTVYSPIYMVLHQQSCVCQPSPSLTVSPLHLAIQTQMSLPYSTPSRIWRRPPGFVTISFPYIEWRRKLLSFGYERKWEGERESRCTCEIGCSTLAYFMAGSTFNGLVCSFEEYLQRVFTNTWTISICTELGRPGIVSEVKNSFILTVRI